METTENNIDLLEQLKGDYSILKDKLEQQEIINDRMLHTVFSSKIKDIHSVGWKVTVLGVFVMAIAPMAFHSNPSMNLSWAFVAATEVMMMVCLWSTWHSHHNVSAPQPGEDLKTFATNVKKMKESYRKWEKIGIGMVIPWIIWMSIELIVKAEYPVTAYITIAIVLVGGTIGGIFGHMMNRKVIRRCDDILNEIERV